MIWTTIAAQSKTCVQRFDRLRSLLQDPECPIHDQQSLSVILDERARFKVWAGNIGALQHGPPSLDHRLGEASHIRDQVMRLLEDLEVSLKEASSIASGERLQGEAARSEPDWEFEFSGSEDFSSSDTDPDLEDSVSKEESQSTTEIEELLLATNDAITSLFKLSIAVRNPTPLDRYAKSAAVSLYDDIYDIGHVWEKFPHARRAPWLVDRLGKAITRRRRHLRYRELHREKLAREPRAAVGGDYGHNETKQQTAVDALERGPRSLIQSRIASTKSSNTLSQTEASTYVPEDIDRLDKLSDTGQSETSFAPSVNEDTAVYLHVPAAPEESANEMPFECPYCYTIQVVSDSRSWKKHVFNDLNPYVCTFEDCALKLFESRQKWFEHEMQAHRKEWYCTSCQQIFESAKGLETHWKGSHSESFTEAQLPALVERGERPLDRIPASSCQLCDTWQVHIRDRAALTDPGSIVGTLVVTPKQFRNHVARHMEQLALFALPRQYGDETSAAGSKASVVVQSSDNSSVDEEGGLAATRVLDEAIELSREARVNMKRSAEELPLYRAAKTGLAELARCLAVEGVDVDAVNADGATAMHEAARNGDEKTILTLYNAGADINVKDLSGSTALHLAADNGHDTTARTLLERGADVDVMDLSGATALRRAAGKGFLSTVQLLIAMGADIHLTDLRGSTALHRASERTHQAVVALLLEHGADINGRDKEGCTPLYRAISRDKNEGVIRMLVSAGADVEERDNKSITPLQAVAGKGRAVAASLLIECGAQVNANGPRSMRALHRAVYKGHEEAALVLLACGADLSLTDDDGWTVLHGAASAGYERIVQQLLRGFDRGSQAMALLVNAADNTGRTALHYAASEGHENIVNDLVEKGADSMLLAKNGQTALAMAVERGQAKVIKLLGEAHIER